MAEVLLAGPEGRIEARYAPADAADAPVAIFLHPHPLHGGTMHNKVVYNLYHALAREGFSCLRFNFRGVGRSEGSYSQGEGELRDATAVLNWLEERHPHARQFVAVGFSFGAWIGMQLLMRRSRIGGFIVVAPPVDRYDFNFLAPCPAPGLVIQGTADTIVSTEAVDEFVDKLSQQRGLVVRYEKIEGADHFFGQSMDDLQALVRDHVHHPLPPRQHGDEAESVEALEVHESL